MEKSHFIQGCGTSRLTTHDKLEIVGVNKTHEGVNARADECALWTLKHKEFQCDHEIKNVDRS